MAASAAKPLSATEFKEHCLAVLDEVARTGRAVIVTRRGIPLARVEAIAPPPARSLLGTVSYAAEADLVGPVDDAWEAES